MLGLVKGTAPPPEVTTPSKRRVAGLRIRRSQVMTTLWRGIPVTTVPQTLVDLAADLSLDDLARACHEAGVRYGTTPAQVKAIRGKHAGAANLRAVLDGDVHVTLSKLEKRFLERLEHAGLPLPVTNRPAGTKRVDCRWPEHRLTVEIDGYRFLNSRHAWEQDREREREAHRKGRRVQALHVRRRRRGPHPRGAQDPHGARGAQPRRRAITVIPGRSTNSRSTSSPASSHQARTSSGDWRCALAGAYQSKLMWLSSSNEDPGR
jgi:hypothetical protein